MRAVITDANVFVSFLIERDETQRAAARDLFLAAESGDILLVIPQFVLFEIVYVLKSVYGVSSANAAVMIHDFTALPGSALSNDCPWPLVLELWPRRLSSIADAAIVALALANRFDSIATFDRKLGRRLKALGVRSYW